MTPHSRETLLALADRAEKATGGDRELDCLIWCATAESHFEYHGGECVLAVQGGFAARLDWKDMSHPTASLDAAMSLAKDFGGEVTFFKDGTAKAYLWQPYPLAVECKKAATPALALCAAALRARATLDPTGEKA